MAGHFLGRSTLCGKKYSSQLKSCSLYVSLLDLLETRGSLMSLEHTTRVVLVAYICRQHPHSGV